MTPSTAPFLLSLRVVLLILACNILANGDSIESQLELIVGTRETPESAETLSWGSAVCDA